MLDVETSFEYGPRASVSAQATPYTSKPDEISLALAIIDCLVVEAERFHANTDDLEAQAIAKFKEQAPVEWTWDKFKGKCNEPIRREGVKLWRNIVTAMRDAGIGEVTKSKPLTFRRHTDADGHRKMSA